MRELRRVFIGALFFLASSYSFAMDVFDLSSQRENLFQVVKNNDEVNLTLLIQSGADLNIQDEEGRGLLYFAVANGHPRIVKIPYQSALVVETSKLSQLSGILLLLKKS